MHSDQKAARIFGGLFLLTFVTSIAGVLLYGPVLDEKDYILSGSADGEITLGALLEVGLVITNIGTAVVLFPIARRYSETLALMIWLAVFPTLTALNVALGDQLDSLSPVARTFVLATIAVPIVIYGLMPHLHRARARLLARRAGTETR